MGVGGGLGLVVAKLAHGNPSPHGPKGPFPPDAQLLAQIV